MNPSDSLWPASTFGYLSGLYMKVLMMKLRLCLPPLDFLSFLNLISSEDRLKQKTVISPIK